MKQTEIGLIPEDWEVKSLGEIGEPCMCKRILKEQTSPTGDIPFYKIGTFGGIPDAYISRELFEQYKEQYNYPKKGTLLLSAAGTIGRVVVFDGKDSYFQDSNIVWIDNDETKVTNDFLFYCYSRMQWKTEEGGIVSRLYNANLKSTSFIAPKSLAEQERIAKALSDVDALISTTEKLIQKKKNIKQGAMQNLLTGKKRLLGFAKSTNYKQTELGPIPEDWEVKNIGTTCNVITGGEAPVVYSKDKNTLYKYPIYSNGKEVYGYHASYTIDHDAVCISSIGENTGDIFYYQKNFTPIIRLKVIIPKKSNIDTEFLYYCLKTIKIDTTKNGGIPNINSNDVKSINYIQPTSKEEQTAIANVLSSMDKEIETLNTKLEKYRNLKTAMMQQLLTGKIRLVN